MVGGGLWVTGKLSACQLASTYCSWLRCTPPLKQAFSGTTAVLPPKHLPRARDVHTIDASSFNATFFISPLLIDTGNTCKHVGYDEFDPPSWPSECAPDKEDWIELDRYVCGTHSKYPEEFWACSDIRLSRGGC